MRPISKAVILRTRTVYEILSRRGTNIFELSKGAFILLFTPLPPNLNYKKQKPNLAIVDVTSSRLRSLALSSRNPSKTRELLI